MSLIIYLGFAINILGAIYLGYTAIKFHYRLKQSLNMPVKRRDDLAQWRSQRHRAFAVMIAGLVIAFIGTML